MAQKVFLIAVVICIVAFFAMNANTRKIGGLSEEQPITPEITKYCVKVHCTLEIYLLISLLVLQIVL